MQAGYDLQQAADEWARSSTTDPTKRMEAHAAFIAGAQWARQRPIEIPGEDSAVAHAQPRTVHRSAESGQFVSAEEAAANPSTTMAQSLPQLVDCDRCGRKRTPY